MKTPTLLIAAALSLSVANAYAAGLPQSATLKYSGSHGLLHARERRARGDPARGELAAL